MYLLNFRNLIFAVILQLRTQIIDSCSKTYTKVYLLYIQMNAISDGIQYPIYSAQMYWGKPEKTQ